MRGLLESPELADTARLRAAQALAAHGDDSALLAPASGKSTGAYHVPDRRDDHWARYGALAALHFGGHPDAAGLLQSFVGTTDAPGTFGAATMLAESGHFDALVSVATDRHRNRVIAIAAARALASVAGTEALQRALPLAGSAEVRSWLAGALVSRGHLEHFAELRHLLRHRQRRRTPPSEKDGAARNVQACKGSRRADAGPAACRLAAAASACRRSRRPYAVPDKSNGIRARQLSSPGAVRPLKPSA